MPLNTETPTVIADEMRIQSVADDKPELQAIHDKGAALASVLPWLPRVPSSHVFAERSSQVRTALFPVLAAVDKSFAQTPLTDDQLSNLLAYLHTL